MKGIFNISYLERESSWGEGNAPEVGCRCKENGAKATGPVCWWGQMGEVGKVILIWGYKGTDKRNGNNWHEGLGKSGQER